MDTEAPQAYRPVLTDLWRTADAAQRITALLTKQLHDLSLGSCMPILDAMIPDRPLRRRAGLASTLVAALELARGGTVSIQQDQPFGTISLEAPQA